MQHEVNNQPEPARRPMVGWYSPGQLIQTGVQVFISTIFGRNSDHRLLEALTGNDAEPPDLTHHFKTLPSGAYACDEETGDYVREGERDEIWIDYVADTGDGWDSTYAVAHAVAAPALTLADPATNRAHVLPRGDVLVFGGDMIYPTPSRREYQDKLVHPYATALPEGSAHPAPFVFATPGNHDWYDSLVSFTRLFCAKERFAAWQARQSRSYYAVKLPHGWWLFGADVQLDSDIDSPQLEYFKKVAKKMEQGDRIILCVPEPGWIRETVYGDIDRAYEQSNLRFLQDHVLKGKAGVRVYVAGDLHHYRRHAQAGAAEPAAVQWITAGGGGAFYHATHGWDVDTLANGAVWKASYPTVEKSRALCRGALLFPYINHNPRWPFKFGLPYLNHNPNSSFGIATGIAYLLTAWAVKAPIGNLGISEWYDAVKNTIRYALITPGASFWWLLVFSGFWLFTDTHSKRYRLWGGLAHSLSHLVAIFFIGWGGLYCSVHVFGPWFERLFGSWVEPWTGSVPQMLASAALIFAGGYVVGPLIFGLYLYVSLACFHRHLDECSSSVAVKDWKNFLRLHIDKAGDLTIYPVGLDRVPRAWRERQDGDPPGPQRVVPDDPRATPPRLIETPVRVV